MIEHFTRNTPARLPAVAAVLAVVVVQVAGLGYSINLHHYRTKCCPVIAFLRARMSRRSLVMGPAELGLALPFGQVVEDLGFGLYSAINRIT